MLEYEYEYISANHKSIISTMEASFYGEFQAKEFSMTMFLIPSE